MDNIFTYSCWNSEHIENEIPYDPAQTSLRNNRLSVKTINLEKVIQTTLEKNIIFDPIKTSN